MNWNVYIEKLRNGEDVTFNPRGQSMAPRIKSGQEVTVKPAPKELKVGSVVLCKVSGRTYLHLIKAIRGDQVQIGNNKGKINGWTSKQNVYGVLEE